MSLFILRSVPGSNDFEFAAAEADIISISAMDTGVGFNEANLVMIEGAGCIPVTYNRTLNGPTSVRLDNLVHDNGFTTPQQIIILGVPSGTIMPNGLNVSDVSGEAFRIGEAGAPFTNHISLIYDTGDCNGSGHWVDKEGGGTTSFPKDVILYHELAHCFHIATGVATTEPLAETDENDMRDVRGLPHRDTSSHNGGCGGGPTSCCIVVSLATDSPYSDEVKRLRYVREHTLRRSAVGDDFFNELHFRYYQFSPEVTSLMGHQRHLGSLIKNWFVAPLVEALEMLIYYSENKGHGLAEFLGTRAGEENLSWLYEQTFLKQLSVYMKLVRNIDDTMLLQVLKRIDKEFPGFKKLIKHINKKTLQDEYIDWALTATVELWVESALSLFAGKAQTEVNNELYKNIKRWISLMPITNIWNNFSRLETEAELISLEQYMFDPESKKIFSERLMAKHPRYSETIIKWAKGKREVRYA